MSEHKRKLLILLTLILFVAVGVVQHFIDPIEIEYNKKSQSVNQSNNSELMVQLPAQFLVATMTGFREVIAGALWIRADTFFHQGQYQAIIPIVRMVTWLDPHNIDVYTTGAWHMDYNFVDQGEMSDKRYIPASIALLKEGIANNPNVWDLYFELGWTHYNKKLMDYQKGLEYIKKACEHEGYDVNTGRVIPRPSFVDNMLAHQYEKVGDYKNAINAWFESEKRVRENMKNPSDKSHDDQSSLDVCDRNLALLYLRIAWRYGDMDAYKKGVDLAEKLANRKFPAVAKWAADGAAKDYAKRLAAHNPPHDALKPLDAGFEVSWRKVSPKVLLISGSLNLVKASEYKDLASEVFTHWYQDNQKAGADKTEGWRDGARVYWMITDYGYKMPELNSFNIKIDRNQTVAWDSMYVAGGSFSLKLDFSNPLDSDFYPFTAKKYKMTIWVTPLDPGMPDYIQDRVGWRGDAITDKHYLDTKTLPGFHMLRKEFIIDRKDIL